jgi:wobble nucleotide-excising tRNase
MDDEEDELALYFSAKKENEELKEAILNDHREIERLHKEVERLNGHINGMRLASISLREGYDRMSSFIKLLDDYPMFWGSSYKRSIMQFLGYNRPEK